MRKILNFVLIVVLLVACFGNFGCGKEIKLPKEETNFNILYDSTLFYSYNSNKLSFVAVELSVKNDLSGFVVYEVTSTQSDDDRTDNEKVERVKEVVTRMSEIVYSSKTFKEGYRFFYQNKNDNFVEGEKLYARVHFYNLNYIYSSNYKILTVAEMASENGESMFSSFHQTNSDKKIDWTTEQNRKVWDKYKVLKLSSLTTRGSEDVKITLESKPISYYCGTENGELKTAKEVKGNSLTFVEGSTSVYIIYNDYYETFSLPTWAIILGSVIILAAAALVTLKILQVRRKK